MKVYQVVGYNEYEGDNVGSNDVKVFFSQEKAEEYKVQLQQKGLMDGYEVYEFEVE